MTVEVPDICDACGDCHALGEACTSAIVGVVFMPGEVGRLTVLRSPLPQWPAGFTVPLRGNRTR